MKKQDRATKRERRRRLLIWLLIIGLLLPTVAAMVVYLAVDESDLTNVRQQITALQAQIEAKEQELEAIRSDKDTLITQKLLLDEKIRLHYEQIALLEEEIGTLDGQITSFIEEIDILETAQAEKYETFKQRVRVLYEDGNLSYLGAVLSADSLTDFLNRIEWVGLLLERDREIIRQLEQYTTEITRQKEQLEQERATAAVLRAELVAVQVALEIDAAEAEYKLESLENGEHTNLALIAEYERLWAEARQQEEKIAKALEEKRKKEEEEQKRIDEEAKKKSLFIWPTPGFTWITSPFGYRKHPVLGTYQFHSGVDIGAYGLSPILAVGAGKVTESRYDSVMGYMIRIDHQNGFISVYCHMNTAARYKTGATVKQGDVVGYVGTTGLSSGYHLHFSLYRNGSLVNPLDYITPK